MSAQDAAQQHLQVPNVFIVPPEEDETPIWCCFDAALPIDQRMTRHPDEMESDIQIFDPTMDYDDDEAMPMDMAEMARRNMETRSIVETLLGRNYNIDHTALDSDSDSGMEWDSENEFAPHPTHTAPSTPAADKGKNSDVIEVVNVGCSKRSMDDMASNQPTPPSQGIKSSGTFKSKATRALRSLTDTFKPSRPRAEDGLPTRPSSSMSHEVRQEEKVEERNRSSPKQNGSAITRRFSQLFTVSSKSRSSLVSTDEPPSPTMSSTSFQSSAPSMSSTPSLSEFGQVSRRSSLYQEANEPDAFTPPTSPNPSTTGKSTTRRFSKLSLQKMFSFSTSSQEPAPPSPVDTPSGRTTPTLKRKSSSLPSTSSESSGPQTPTSTEDGLHARPSMSTIIFDKEGQSPQIDFGDFETGLGMGIHSEPSLNQRFSISSNSSALSAGSVVTTTGPKRNSTSNSASHSSLSSNEDESRGDLGFEMKLDSLQFESLSIDFDPHRFSVGHS